jgi:hypothetical protein
VAEPNPKPNPDANAGGTQPKRVNVVFSPETYSALEELATSQNINISDALRQAISVSSLVVKADKDPKSRLLIDRGGQVQELKLIT